MSPLERNLFQNQEACYDKLEAYIRETQLHFTEKIEDVSYDDYV
jgi:hypothetical protein